MGGFDSKLRPPPTVVVKLVRHDQESPFGSSATLSNNSKCSPLSLKLGQGFPWPKLTGQLLTWKMVPQIFGATHVQGMNYQVSVFFFAGWHFILAAFLSKYPKFPVVSMLIQILGCCWNFDLQIRFKWQKIHQLDNQWLRFYLDFMCNRTVAKILQVIDNCGSHGISKGGFNKS